MSKQQKLIVVSDEEARWSEALLSRGYIVIKPSEDVSKIIKDYSHINNINDLVKFFYTRLSFYNQNRTVHYSMASNMDKKLAGNFLKSRMTTGIGKKRALVECAHIIDVLLRYENLFGLNKPITNMSVLGQDKSKWITDSVISFINKEQSVISDILEEREMEEVMNEIGKNEFGLEY